VKIGQCQKAAPSRHDLKREHLWTWTRRQIIAEFSAQYARARLRPDHDRRYAIDASKLERELGCQAQENFESGIEKTVRWYNRATRQAAMIVSDHGAGFTCDVMLQTCNDQQNTDQLQHDQTPRVGSLLNMPT
jgi:hypothetical protein